MATSLPRLSTVRPEDLLGGPGRAELEKLLPAYLAGRRWFGGKARRIAAASIEEVIAVPVGGSRPAPAILLVRVEYGDGATDTYAVPIAVVPEVAGGVPPSAIARVSLDGHAGFAVDALEDPALPEAVLSGIEAGSTIPGGAGDLAMRSTDAFAGARGTGSLEPRAMGAEQSNTSVRYGDRLILKFFRRLEGGPSPDLEIGRFLTEKARFPHTPAVAGWIEYRRRAAAAAGAPPEPATVAILQAFVPNRGDAWKFTIESLGGFFDRARGPAPSLPRSPLLRMAGERRSIGDHIEAAGLLGRQEIGDYLEAARLLGRRTAEMHVALAGGAGDPAFAPEPLSAARLDAAVRGRLALADRSFRDLRERIAGLGGAAAEAAGAVLAREGEVRDRLRPALEQETAGLRIRCHGDYHLGQVLFTGSDFAVIDFEGEPARPLAERREKKCPLIDVAGMLRSFHYAPHARLFGHGGPPADPAEFERLAPWARLWYLRVGAVFLAAYFETARSGPVEFLPESSGQMAALLDAFLLEKAVYELGYELNNRPDWVRIPLHGILELVG